MKKNIGLKIFIIIIFIIFISAILNGNSDTLYSAAVGGLSGLFISIVYYLKDLIIVKKKKKIIKNNKAIKTQQKQYKEDIEKAEDDGLIPR